MVVQGNMTIHTPRKQEWDFLTDLNQIGLRVPGVDKLGIIERAINYPAGVSKGRLPVSQLLSKQFNIEAHL